MLIFILRDLAQESQILINVAIHLFVFLFSACLSVSSSSSLEVRENLDSSATGINRFCSRFSQLARWFDSLYFQLHKLYGFLSFQDFLSQRLKKDCQNE